MIDIYYLSLKLDNINVFCLDIFQLFTLNDGAVKSSRNKNIMIYSWFLKLLLQIFKNYLNSNNINFLIQIVQLILVISIQGLAVIVH